MESLGGERAARAAFLAEAQALTPYVAVDSGDELFVVATDDLGPGRELFVKRHARDMVVLERALAHLRDFGVRLPPDPVFVDVGANIGTTTVAALRRHGFASAVALEPSPENYRLLRINLLLNDLDRDVRALQVAVSDEERRVGFNAADAKRGRHHIDERPGTDPSQLTVQAVTLDGLVGDGVIERERVGLLWLDAARHEGEALAAATTLIEAGIPIVTALRPDPEDGKRTAREPWASLLPRLVAHYTDVVDLRRTDPRKHGSISELGPRVDSATETHDLLLVRR